MMKYRQLDRITLLTPGKVLIAERTLRADEQYLEDHFPRFPVMPGVMMLEALHQASVWLIRVTDEFKTPLVLLREVRGVKFGDFLAPGETLKITAEFLKQDGDRVTIKANAMKGERVTVTARLVLQRCHSSDPPRLGTDDDLRKQAKTQFRELFGNVTLSV